MLMRYGIYNVTQRLRPEPWCRQKALRNAPTFSRQKSGYDMHESTACGQAPPTDMKSKHELSRTETSAFLRWMRMTRKRGGARKRRNTLRSGWDGSRKRQHGPSPLALRRCINVLLPAHMLQRGRRRPARLQELGEFV